MPSRCSAHQAHQPGSRCRLTTGSYLSRHRDRATWVSPGTSSCGSALMRIELRVDRKGQWTLRSCHLDLAHLSSRGPGRISTRSRTPASVPCIKAGFRSRRQSSEMGTSKEVPSVLHRGPGGFHIVLCIPHFIVTVDIASLASWLGHASMRPERDTGAAATLNLRRRGRRL